MKKYNIQANKVSELSEIDIDEIQELVNEFAKLCEPYEENLYLHVDFLNNAIYCECHICAEKLIDNGTIDVPLDPDEQSEYRANRDIVEDHVAFEQMKRDALDGRTFSNIVTEFDTQSNPNFPLKIIGGQHRYIAIEEAILEKVDKWHGIKVYFSLDKDQRLNVQLISNVNIAASTDLYDRLQETAQGPELRNWCQEVGFLDPGQDFSSKRQRGSAITVREVRSFIVNYCLGKKVNLKNFENVDTTPIICKTGRPDKDWDDLKKKSPKIWKDKKLVEAAKEFVALDEIQREVVEKNKPKISAKFAEKALNFAIITSWVFVAGALQKNLIRLERHYNLKTTRKSKDPLNGEAMAKARHKSDPENYRGLATRNDVKERSRCVEMFYLQSEKGSGITSAVCDVGIKRSVKKQANLDLLDAERKI